MMFKAADKYNSILRAYERLKIIGTNTGNKHGNTEAKDATEDFFNQCYHLKDWIKKEKNISLQSEVEKYISDSKYLSIAADYCNVFKHGGLDPNRKQRHTKNIEKLNTHVKFDLTNKGFVASSKLEISIGDKKYDSLELAENCINEWNIFLHKNGIVFKS